MEADSHQTQVAQTRLLGAETPPQVTSTSSMLSVSTLKLSANPLTSTIWQAAPGELPARGAARPGLQPAAVCGQSRAARRHSGLPALQVNITCSK